MLYFWRAFCKLALANSGLIVGQKAGNYERISGTKGGPEEVKQLFKLPPQKGIKVKPGEKLVESVAMSKDQGQL